MRNPQAEIRQLRSKLGGMKLANKIVSDDFERYLAALFVVGRAGWTAHANKATNIKTPRDGVRYYFHMSNGGWKDEIENICNDTLRDRANHKFMGFLEPCANDRIVNDTVELMLHFVANRAYSLMLVSTTPPVKYAGLLHTNPDARERAVNEMRSDWNMWCWVERQVAERKHDADEIVGDVFWMSLKPVRLLFMLYERGGWSATFGDAASF